MLGLRRSNKNSVWGFASAAGRSKWFLFSISRNDFSSGRHRNAYGMWTATLWIGVRMGIGAHELKAVLDAETARAGEKT